MRASILFVALLLIPAAARGAAPARHGAQPEAVRARAAKTGPEPLSPTRSTLRALEVVRRGVTAMGGADALRAVRTVFRTMKAQWTDPGQALKPTEEAASPPIGLDDVKSFIDLPGHRLYETFEDFTDEGDRYRRITAVAPDSGYEAARYFEERPFFTRYATGDLPGLYARFTRRYPEALLLQVLARPEALEWIGTVADTGGARDRVSWADVAGVRLVLEFDARTGRLAGNEFVRDHPVFGTTTRHIVYGDYRRVGSLTLPFSCDDRIAERSVWRYSTSEIVLDAEPAADVRFAPPADGTLGGADPDAPELTRLGGDLYLLRGPYNSIFEVFDNYVVVVEAGQGTALSEQCIERIRSVAEAKPIRYVVATHFHFDHLAGLRPYLHLGATVITTPDAKAVVARVASTEHPLRPDAHTVPTSSVRIEVVSGSRVLEDAHHRLEIHDIGPNMHVAQMLVAYSPRHRVLLEPDLLDGGPGEPLDGGPYTVQLARAIDERKLDVATIVPVHGRVVPRSYLDGSLSVRRRHIPE